MKVGKYILFQILETECLIPSRKMSEKIKKLAKDILPDKEKYIRRNKVDLSEINKNTISISESIEDFEAVKIKKPVSSTKKGMKKLLSKAKTSKSKDRIPVHERLGKVKKDETYKKKKPFWKKGKLNVEQRMERKALKASAQVSNSMSHSNRPNLPPPSWQQVLPQNNFPNQ